MADFSQYSDEDLTGTLAAMVAAGKSTTPVAGESSPPIVKSVSDMSDAELQEAVEFGDMAAKMSPQDLSIARLTGKKPITPTGKQRVLSPKMERFGEFLRQQAQQPRPGETEDSRFKRLHGGLSSREKPSWIEGVGRDVLQGDTFGFGDEIVAGGTAALDSLVGDANFEDAYNQRLANERADRSTFREEYPVSSYGAEITGAIPTAIAAPLNLLRGGKVLQAAGVGAGQGAVYGFGQGEGVGGRAMNAALGTALGGTVGALGVPISRGIGNVTRSIMDRRSAKSVGMTPDQYSILNRALNADESLTGAGTRRLEAAGDDAMLADAGPGAARLLDTAIVETPPASRMATEAVETRVTRQAEKLDDALNQTMGKPGESSSRALTVFGEKTNHLDLIYKNAYSKPIDYSSAKGLALEKIIANRVPGEAIDAANKLMRMEGKVSNQILADVAEDGTVIFRELPDVRQIDYITRGLNQTASTGEGAGAMGGQTQIGAAYQKVSRDIRNLLKELVPEYKVALNTSSDAIRERNAREFGLGVLTNKTSRSDVKEAMDHMGGAEKRKVVEGVRMYIDDVLAQTKVAMTDVNIPAREAFKFVKDMSSRASREKLSTILGQDASKVINQLDEALVAFELRANVARNSATAVRQSTAKDVSDIVQGGAWNKLREGEVINAPKAAIAAILGRSPSAKQKVSDDVYVGMVKALTGPRGPEARALLQKLQKIQPLIDQRTGKTIDLISNITSRNAPFTNENIRPEFRPQIDSMKKALGVE